MFEQMRQRLIEKAIRGQLVPQSDSEPEVEQIGEVSEDVPFEIPTKWKWVQLKNVGQVVGGGTPKTHVIEFWGGTISWITPADLGKNKNKFITFGSKSITEDGLNNSSAKLMPKGSVVYSSRAPIGHIAISDNEVCTNQGCKSLVPNFDLTSSDWAYYVLIARTDDIKSRASGTTFKEISAKGMGETWFPLPSIEEQKRIISELETLLAEIDKAEKAYNDLTGPLVEQYKALILDKAMRGQLVPRLDSEPEVKQMGEATEEIPFSIPKKWKWVQIKDISLKITDGEHKTPHYRCDGGIPFVSVKNISSGYLDFQNTKFISEQDHEIFRKRCNPELGDLLISKVGTTGVPALVETETPFSLFVSVALLKLNTQLIFPKFAYYLVLSSLVQSQVRKTTRGLNKNWVLKEISETKIVLPPLEEQHRIVSKLELLLNQINIFSI